MPDDWRPRASRAATRLANCARTGAAREGRKARRAPFVWRPRSAGGRVHRRNQRIPLSLQSSRRWEGQMDKIVKLNHRLKKRASRQPPVVRPSRAEAEDAVRTLIRWAGDDPYREGLVGTPARVARAYEEWFSGYFEDPRD